MIPNSKEINLAIQSLISSSEGLKYFYQFIANNPHLSLHNCCQILIQKPNLTYCYSFEEWNAMGRRIIRGGKGISYYDEENNRKFVFDITKTYGKTYETEDYFDKDLIQLLKQFNKNENQLIDNTYQNIKKEIKYYLDNNEISDKRNQDFLIEGISFLLYCKENFETDEEITIKGLPYSLKENAQIVKEIYEKTSEIITQLLKINLTHAEEKKKTIQQRKRKPQTLLDLLDEKKVKEDELIEKILLQGSSFENGKKRIFEEYKKEPTLKEFASFLKNEYGTGGSLSNNVNLSYNSKGIKISHFIESVEENIIFLNWNEVAIRIADLIDEGKYYNPEEEKKEKVNSIVDYVIKQGLAESISGSWIIYYDELKENQTFVQHNLQIFVDTLSSREEVASVDIEEDRIDIVFYLSYLQHQEENEKSEEESFTNFDEFQNTTSLENGAKARAKANIKAIQLVKALQETKRKPNQEEKETLKKYVGWGGIPQIFDSEDPSWTKEHQELKNILTSDEYQKAKSSVLNAHYTPKEIITFIYQVLQRLGVKENNKFLDPAMGIGNFYQHMPNPLKQNAKLYGVELDTITGYIAQSCFSNVAIQIKGFEETQFPNDYFDIILTNVPFGAYSIYDTNDSKYNQYHFYIHDYFIAKSIDKVRAGGLVAIITSKGSLDKINSSARKYIADRAILLGAVRLPNNAFEQTAKTKVVTDILIFQKRKELINSNTENTNWLKVGQTEEGFSINQYFIENRQMILGNLVEERGLYESNEMVVKPFERPLQESLNEILEVFPQNIYENPQIEKKEEKEDKETIPVDYSIKPYCYSIVNQKLYMRIQDEMVEQAIPKKPTDSLKRIEKMILIRNQIHHILNLQLNACSDEELKQAQKELNQSYDSFIQHYGYLNNQTNYKLFKDDGDSSLLFACENHNEETNRITKSDIFTKRTIRPYQEPTKTSDCFEALQASKNVLGKVDIAYIEELTGKNYEQVINELQTAIFRNPEKMDIKDRYSGFETNEEYLSGNVVRKLEIAKKYATEYKEYDFKKNIQSLEEVQPQPIKANEISVQIGTRWINNQYYQQFLVELLKIPYWMKDKLQIEYNSYDSSYQIERSNLVRRYVSDTLLHQTYGTSRANCYRLFEDCLNLKTTTIYDSYQDEDGKNHRVLNKEETILAREKQNQLKEIFKEWIFEDVTRREELEKTYNSLFNQIRIATYDGSYLKFPQMNPAIELKPHQKNAVHRIITSGNTLLHHVVGAGKTYTICASLMKLKQYGLAKKAMIVVPNHLVGQWESEFRKLYPNAKLFVTKKEDLVKEKRKRFVSKVALEDWDAIIISQSCFFKIPISTQRQIKKIQEEIQKIEATITSQSKSSRGSIKNLERIKKNKEVTLKNLMSEDKKDNVLVFEKLGVDRLFIDEADCYKNLFLYTKMNNVSGISTAASQRASDLQLKCEYITEFYQEDKGIVFATGTPISNSMTEMYTLQTYLQKYTLEKLKIPFFDAWAANFGETTTSLELSPSGQGYRAKTRFSKFTNLPELLTLYRSFADVQTSDMVKLDVPEVEKKVIYLKPNDTIKQLTEEIAIRAEKINEGQVDPHEDNMLKITSDGKKIALDPRVYDKNFPSEEGNKIQVCSEKIYEIWQKTKDFKGTQICFCDLSTPKVAFDEYTYGKDFDVYNDLKYKLVAMGIPKEEIAYIHEANSDLQKQILFNNVNAGNIRILLGSTEKCGAGTNVQKRLIALHHLDTPYRPRDLLQREGRIVRQGNHNKKVEIYTYVTEKTFDSYSYQILENKQRFISQIDKGDLTIRESEDIDETTLTYAEIKAITTSNPKIKQKMEIDTEVSKLRILESQYKKNLFQLQDKIKNQLPQQIQKQTLYLEKIEQDLKHLQNNEQNPFSIYVLGQEYLDRKTGGEALTKALLENPNGKIVAKYRGFKISLDPPSILLTIEKSITLTNFGEYSLSIGESSVGNLIRIDNFFNDFVNLKQRVENKKEQLKQDLLLSQEEVKKPFEKAERLKLLLVQQSKINIELNLEKKEEIIIDNEDNEASKMTTDNFSNKIMVLPDDQISIHQMNKFGYNWAGMLPLTKKRANQLFESCAIYLLYSDNSEVLAQTLEELNHHDGLFGIEIPSWNTYLEELQPKEIENYQDKPSLDYKQIVRENIKKEYYLYTNKELSKLPIQILQNAYKNFIYAQIYQYLLSEQQLEEIHYRCLAQEKDSVITLLYDFYLKNENASIEDYSQIKELIENYNKKYHSEILKEESEDKMQKQDKNIKISLPYEALIKKYEYHSFFKMPETSDYQGYTFNIYNNHIKNSQRKRDTQSEELENCLEISIDKDEEIIIKRDKTSVTLSATEFEKFIHQTKKEDYLVENNWYYQTIPTQAIVSKYNENTILKMPKGNYQGFSFILSDKLIKTNPDTNEIKISLSKDYTIKLKNYQDNKTIELKANELLEELKNKNVEDYQFEFIQPSKTNMFSKIESRLVNNIPLEMQNRKNWCVLRTRKNEETGKLEKYIIDCHTGKFAKSDDPTTWSEFSIACEYAKEHGGVGLVYALDGKDEIACIDLDHCIDDETKEFTKLAKEVISKSNGTYLEKSISGTGLHLFGKTKGMNLRSFSKDGDLEFYQNAHFIAMTGDLIGEKKLESFDHEEMIDLLNQKCGQRPSLQGVGKGVEGLSLLNDKEVVEKAIHAKNGETFRKLYKGEDLQNNHSNSDMSLMNRLAFWCNGNKEQMLRIFATSGLYRENKKIEYYEYTATKAIEDIQDRFQNQQKESYIPYDTKKVTFEKA